MGVGNFYLSNAETIYIDHSAVYGEFLLDEDRYEHLENELDSEIYYEDLIDDLRELLPKSYDIDIRESAKEGVIIAENRFYQISIVDYVGYFAINVILQDDFGFENEVHPLAEANHVKAATSFFDKIVDRYPGHVNQRCCAWTSGEYVHSKKAA